MIGGGLLGWSMCSCSACSWPAAPSASAHNGDRRCRIKKHAPKALAHPNLASRPLALVLPSRPLPMPSRPLKWLDGRSLSDSTVRLLPHPVAPAAVRLEWEVLQRGVKRGFRRG